jgi:hypothetical protein
VRYLAMVLVALMTVGMPAVADVDPAVMAMLSQWSLASPNPSRVVICHGFGCAFRTEIALTDADHAQMAAIMASGAASAQGERAAIGVPRRGLNGVSAPSPALRSVLRGPAPSSAARSIAANSTASIPPTTRIHSCSFSINSDCSSTIQLRRRPLGFPRTTPQ